jgi:hypothetical protein
MAERKQKSAKEKSEIEQLLERIGGAEALAQLNADPLDVRDIVQEGYDPLAFYGSDYRPELIRYSWVSNEQQAARLRDQRFFPITGDVKMRGISTGIIMGRLMKDEAVYQAGRRKKDYERRTGKTTDVRNMGDPGQNGRFSLATNNTPRKKRLGED